MSMKRPASIAICGGIAVGKTTFGRHLAELLPNCHYFAEDVDDNQFLADFYRDMKAWGFHSRIAFLAMKAKIYRQLDVEADYVIIDRPIHELITFARLQYALGTLENRDFDTYLSLYETLVSLLPEIDIVFYLHCSPQTSLERIGRRGRPFERSIVASYLEMVIAHYDEWIASLNPQRVIRINTDDVSDMRACALRASEDLRRVLQTTPEGL